MRNYRKLDIWKKGIEIEFKRFLEIAMGSFFEIQNHRVIASELEFMSKTKLENLQNF